MASLLSGSKHKARQLLYISTEEFDLTIKGVPQNETVEAFNFHQSKDGSPVKGDLNYTPEIAKVWVYNPATEELEEYQGGGLYPCFFERTNYELIIERKEGCHFELAVDHPNPRLREAVTPAGSKEDILSGIINFDDEVGFSQFEVKGNGRSLLTFEIQVFPSKMDYYNDFWLLLDEVNEEVYNLAFDFLKKTSFPAELRKDKEGSSAEFYSIINALFQRLQSSLEQILQRPHHKIEPVNKIVPVHKAKKSDHRTAAWLASRPYLFEKVEQGLTINESHYLPRRTMDSKKEVTYDTYENRFIKWMLRKLDRKLKYFQSKYQENYKENADAKVHQRTDEMRRYLNQYCRRSFFNEVGSLNTLQNTSLVMQMAPGYRQAYKYYLMITKGLNINKSLFNVSLKDMAQLYEYWCFLKINQLLRQKYQLVRNNLVAVEQEGVTVKLKRGRESQIEYQDPRNNERFTLVYNRSFIDLPTVAQKPDNMVELEKKDARTSHVYVFDAKYRIKVDQEYVKTFGQPGPPEDTINAMHRYRDALVSKLNGEDDYQRKVLGACVLFPHNDAQGYIGKREGAPSKFYESIDKVGIGALPFLPQQTSLVEKLLDELIWESSQSAVERTVPQAGLERLPREESKKNILIGPLGRKEQLQVCLDHNMYYTYLPLVQSYLGAIEYITIYQSRSKFTEEEGQGIFYYGKVLDFEVKKRKEIKEISPRGRGEEIAVQFYIERWEKKVPPISPAGYGPVVPYFTSWELFKEARLYPELHLKNEEVSLWRELRRFHQCRSLRFPNKNIRTDDQVELIEYPGLIVENMGQDRVKIKVSGQERTVDLRTLKRRPARILRDIINLWSRSNLEQ